MFIIRLARLVALTVFSFISVCTSNPTEAPREEYGVYLCSYEQSAKYEVTDFEGGYLLETDTGGILFYDFYEAINSLPDSSTVRLNGISVCGGVIERDLTLSGELTVESGSVAISVASVTFQDLSLALTAGSLLIKDGELRINGGEIHSLASDAVALVSSSATLFLNGGVISAENSSAIRNTLGKTVIDGGSLSANNGYCIYNSSELILSGGSLTSVGCEISTSVPISVSHGGKYFLEKLSVEYREALKRGSITPIFYNAVGAQTELFTLLDSCGEEFPLVFTVSSDMIFEECFISVNLPYEVKLYHDGELVHTERVYEGERISEPSVPIPKGYSLSGWYTDYSLNEKFDFTKAISSDLSLFGGFDLLPLSFEISSLSFTYDKTAHTLGFDRIYHPCLNEGKLYYKWYKNGVLVSSEQHLKISQVSDSGAYKCELTFTYNGDFSYSSTPDLTVLVSPLKLSVPPFAPKEYTGGLLYPEIEDSSLYYLDFKGAKDAGEYTVTLRLHDAVNYAFEENGSADLQMKFKILRAKNSFTEIKINEQYFIGQPFDAVFRSRFGEPRLLFSADESLGYSDSFPNEEGIYFVMASVEPCENYEGIASAPISFNLKKDMLISLDLSAPPNKLSYRAFELLSLDGISLVASYLSGIQAEVPTECIEVEYKNQYGLSVTDRSVILRFLDMAIPLSVSVEPCDYDISDIGFEDTVTFFNGTRQSISVAGKVFGKDGKELTLTVRGGGVNAGRYTVSLEFKSQSLNYNTPDTVYKTLDILPLEIYCEYSELEFVYDGRLKAPSAVAYGINSQRLPVSLSGGRTDAGHYTATATVNDSNYSLKNPTVEFVINKAELNLDGVRLLCDSFIYDGKQKSVSLVGLPPTVLAVGYLDSSATEAGEYLMRASVSFDERNYCHSGILSFRWRIAPGEYDMSGIAFLDTEAVYDGSYHLPRVIGSLISGADGSIPKYSFLGGVREVSGDWSSVTVAFTSESKNYNAPSSITARVLVRPREIEVEWGNLSHIYDGAEKCGYAVSDLCEISVAGGGIDAGVYTLTATAVSPNYTVVNSIAELSIAKMQNEFTALPSVLSAYFGDAIIKNGKTKYGSAVFSFYLDSSLSLQIDEPTAVGSYYMTVSTPEGINYLSIVSEPIAFSILPIEPISIEAQIEKNKLLALDTITEADITVYYINNNSTRTEVPFSEISVSYKNGKALSFGECEVGIKVGEFYTTVEVVVARRSYDMSEVRWENTVHTYDKNEKTAELVGLPEGVSVKEYLLNKAVNAGQYRLSCMLEYDSENYNEPQIPQSDLIIYKSEITLPSGAVFTYDKQQKHLKIEDTEYFVGGEVYGTECGKYRVILTPHDNENYCFKDGDGSVYLEILPREITLRVGQDFKSFSIVDGSILAGDDIGAKYEEIDGFVYISVQNPNYKATVIPRNINDKSADLWLILFAVTLLLTLSFLTYFIFKRREALLSGKTAQQRQRRVSKPSEKSDLSAVNTLTETLMCVDRVYADSLISNALAKTLKKKIERKSVPQGTGVARISVGEISAVFKAGDTVDLTALKEKKLIDTDSGRIKITADGVIDKPLSVYADFFEPSALKMIALTGGESFKVKKACPDILRKIFKNT